MRVKLTLAFHGSVLPDGSNGGNPCGFVLTFPDGTRIYDAADTALFGDMALIGEEGLDLAILPIGDYYTMGPDDAVRAVKLLKPRYRPADPLQHVPADHPGRRRLGRAGQGRDVCRAGRPPAGGLVRDPEEMREGFTMSTVTTMPRPAATRSPAAPAVHRRRFLSCRRCPSAGSRSTNITG